MSAAKNQVPVINGPKPGFVTIGNTPRNIRSRIDSLDWPRISASLHESGWACTGEILTPQECDELRALYSNDNLFRSRVVMARHRFGLGEYKYFAYPLPRLVGVSGVRVRGVNLENPLAHADERTAEYALRVGGYLVSL